MDDAPDFMMYVVMVKVGGKFSPWWFGGTEGAYAAGFPTRSQASKVLRIYRKEHGKENAYVQQFGPYS